MSEKPLHEQTVAEREAAAHAAIAAASKTPEQIAAERAAAAEQARKDDEARAEAVKQERLAQERKAWQETKFFEANPDFCINDGTPENQKGKLNGRVLGAAMTAKNLPWTAENLTATFKELQASGNLLPHAVRPPAPPPAPRVNTQGMTLKQFYAMSPADSRKYYKEHREIVDFLVEEKNAGRS
jgi:hypothetical protein